MQKVYGIGIYSEGKYKSKIDGQRTLEYEYWQTMLGRCYSKKVKERQLSYDQCGVCEEWLDFQKFAEWFNNNYYEVKGEKMHIDKDIIFKNNRIYSPETCVFVPERINTLFVKQKRHRGEYPIGVSYYKRNGKFVSYCSTVTKGKKLYKFLGYYNTPEEAFYKGYKPFKENYIKQVADEYKDQIPQKLYDAMYNYIVEIND